MFNTCEGCDYYEKPECKRYPPTKDGYPLAHRGCGEKRTTPVAREVKPVEVKKEEPIAAAHPAAPVKAPETFKRPFRKR